MIGASGYVVKAAAESELVEAVRAAAAGGTYLTPALGARLAKAAPRPSPAAGGAMAELDIGATFAGHRIEGVAGCGGMGVVFRATDLALERRVALKHIARPWPTMPCSAPASSASAGSPPRSTIPTWSTSSTPARSAGSST